jgi:hypothetical protein
MLDADLERLEVLIFYQPIDRLDAVPPGDIEQLGELPVSELDQAVAIGQVTEHDQGKAIGAGSG